MINKYIIFQG